MKIKEDFISNSSSTSYIVFIPESFDIEKCLDHMEKKKIFVNLYDPNGDIKNYKEEIVNIFSDLLNHGEVCEYDYGYEAYGELINIIIQNNLCIKNMDTSSDNGWIVNFNSQKNSDKINKLKSCKFNYE